MIIFSAAYSALRDSKVVNEPGPAISGKAIGIMDDPPSGPLFRKISTSKIISSEKIKMINAPATANDWISTLNNFNTASPENRKTIRISKATELAFSA
jgi:hypothetical protein